MHLGEISFKNGGGALAYKVYIKKAGDTNYTMYRKFDASSSAYDTVETVNLSFYGLEQNTTYLWYVEATNGSFTLLDTVESDVWYFTTDVVSGGSGGAYYPIRDSLELKRYLVAAADNKLYYET
jgi:hypothetical protein